jgi:adenosylcobinamide kinase/adenosylcobinamide-phosphate guanylyltransferase
MHNMTLITGGGRSGKSALALSRAAAYGPGAFIATAQPVDDEMRQRIERHRQERPVSLVTIEEPLDLSAALRRIPEDARVAVVDCLAVWVGNLMHHCPGHEPDEIDRFLGGLNAPPVDLIIVTNEVGMGIVPDNEMSRQYRDLLGTVNQRVAALAQEVVLMVSGIPLVIKGGDRE